MPCKWVSSVAAVVSRWNSILTLPNSSKSIRLRLVVYLIQNKISCKSIWKALWSWVVYSSLSDPQTFTSPIGGHCYDGYLGNSFLRLHPSYYHICQPYFSTASRHEADQSDYDIVSNILHHDCNTIMLPSYVGQVYYQRNLQRWSVTKHGHENFDSLRALCLFSPYLLQVNAFAWVVRCTEKHKVIAL